MNDTCVLDSIAVIPYHIEDSFTATMTLELEHGKWYGDSRMATMMQAMMEKRAFEKFHSVNFGIFLREKDLRNDIVALVLSDGDRSAVGHDRRAPPTSRRRGENGDRHGQSSKLKLWRKSEKIRPSHWEDRICSFVTVKGVPANGRHW